MPSPVGGALELPDALRPPDTPLRRAPGAPTLTLPPLYSDDARYAGASWDLAELLAPCSVATPSREVESGLAGPEPCREIGRRYAVFMESFEQLWDAEYAAGLVDASVNGENGCWDGHPAVELAMDHAQSQLLDRFRCAGGLTGEGPAGIWSWRCQTFGELLDARFARWVPDRVVAALGDPTAERYVTTYCGAR